MRILSAALVLVAAVSTTACSDLTRPDEIKIIAEAPPAPKPAPAPAAAAPADGAGAAAKRAPAARDSGGGQKAGG